MQLGAPVPSEPIGSLLETLKGMFDVVVVDTSGTFDDYVLHALDHSDLLVLVGTLDIPSLKSLKLAAGTLDLLNLPRETLAAGAQPGRRQGRASPPASSRRPSGSRPTSASRPAATCSRRSTAGETIVRANRGHQVSKALDVASRRSLVRDASVDRSAPETRRPRHLTPVEERRVAGSCSRKVA